MSHAASRQGELHETRLVCVTCPSKGGLLIGLGVGCWLGVGGLLGLGCEAILRHVRQAWPAGDHATRDQDTPKIQDEKRRFPLGNEI